MTYTPAPLGKRFLALLIDVAAIWVVFGILRIPVSVAMSAADASLGAELVVSLLFMVVALALGVAWAYAKGTPKGSPGMRIMGTRLVLVDSGAPLGFGRSLLRQVVMSLGGSIVVGYFSPFFNPMRRGWHDLAVGSMVVPAESVAASEPVADGAAPATTAPPAMPPAPARTAPVAAPPAAESEAPADATVLAAPGSRPGQVINAVPGMAPHGQSAPAPATEAPQPAAAPIASVPLAAAPAAAPAPGPAPVVEPPAIVTPPPAPVVAPVPAVATPPAAPTRAPAPAPTPASAPAPAPGDDFDATRVAVAPSAVGVLTWDDGTVTTITSAAVMGRNPDAMTFDSPLLVPITDNTRSLSKTHFSVQAVDGAFHVTDLHSTNGVAVKVGDTVNQLAAGEAAPLPHGAMLVMGDRSARFEVR